MGMDFARKHNIRLAVRNTGHAYNGQSSANGGIVVLMADFQNIKVNPGENATITVGGGCTWGPVYQAANDAGYVSTGGHDPTVGVVGCMIGACHGEYTREFGYTADLVTSLTVVMPGENEAQVMQVDQDNNADLFWAIRGAGGGFGVIVEATFKIFPAPPSPVITTWEVLGPDDVSQGAMCPQLRGKTAEEQETLERARLSWRSRAVEKVVVERGMDEIAALGMERCIHGLQRNVDVCRLQPHGRP